MTGKGWGYCTPRGAALTPPERWRSETGVPRRIRRGPGRGGSWDGAWAGGWRPRGRRRSCFRAWGPERADAPVSRGGDTGAEIRRLQARAQDVKSELHAIEGRLARLQEASRPSEPETERADD